jgi:hypothetical protein
VTFESGVDANFIETQARFRYGTNKNSLINATAWQSIGSNYYEVPFNKTVQSLLPGAVYYYRVEAQNSLGTTFGELDSILTRSTPVITVSGDLTYCLGDSVSLSASVAAIDSTVTGNWTYNNTVISAGTSLKYLFSAAGTYVLNYEVSGSYSNANSVSKTITVVDGNANPVSISYSGSTQLCQGVTLTLDLPSGYSNITWNDGSTNASLVASSTGQYSATMTDPGTGCSVSSNTVSVVVNPLPSASVVSSTGSNSICFGESLDLQAPTGASSYQWNLNGSPIIGGTDSVLTVSTSGTYTVEVESSAGCSALSSGTSVAVNALPTATITSGSSLSFCEGDSVVLTAPANLTYAWTTGATTQSITAMASGQVGLTVTDANGCSATATPVQVTTYNVPALSITAPAGTSICAGESTTLTASAGFSSYAWGSGSTSISKIVTSSGTYTVTGTTADGCTATATETVTVNAAPLATITNLGSSTLCSGDSTTLSAPSGMSSYVWSNGATTQDITTAAAGNYTVTITNADGCSATSAATSINTSQITAPSITASGAVTFCDGGSVVLGIPMGYSSYSWNNNLNTTQITATTSGDYFATVSNSDGCTTTSDTVTVTVNPLPATPTITYTMSDTIMISSAPQGNQWYFNGVQLSGATDDTLRPYNFGNYSVMVEDANGCESGMSAMQFYNSVGLEEDLRAQIKLYPNPTTGQVTLELGAIETERIVLQDALGRMLMVKEAPGATVQIDLENEAAGVYFIRVFTSTGDVFNLNVAKK